MDTTGVTVTANNITRGTTALAANGETITGTLDVAPLYNGLDKTTEGYALDARQGKVLKDSIDALGAPVRYDAEQALSTSRQQIARGNIGAAAQEDFESLGLFIKNGKLYQRYLKEV